MKWLKRCLQFLSLNMVAINTFNEPSWLDNNDWRHFVQDINFFLLLWNRKYPATGEYVNDVLI